MMPTQLPPNEIIVDKKAVMMRAPVATNFASSAGEPGFVSLWQPKAAEPAARYAGIVRVVIVWCLSVEAGA
jgi:hypothetical protein